ncbi:MAG: PQQ-binding-like beta-propeller repeat protein [Pirellulales bacterium]|nr:PQQ-binding-like beta-propeller repeat protein [Pirellulales bacterium]
MLGQVLAFGPRGLAADPEQARQILAASGVQGGLIVHLGCGDGSLTAALHASDSYLVHGLDAQQANVDQARRNLQARGLYGPVSVEQHSGTRLPYADNLVNLVVAEDLGGVAMDEVLRVLVPDGVAYLKRDGKWTRSVKPRPAEIDEWTHYLHDPSNNAVARDTVVGPPRRLQWTCGPDWSRHHDHMASLSALVSAHGRIFYIMDEGPREAILLPAHWMLIARDAFNGTILWKRPIAEWNTHLWPLKSGPNQLPRRLVAVGDRVYATLGIDAPLSALDAATGATIRTYAATEHTDEVLVSDGVLFLLVAESPNKWKEYRPASTYVWDNTRRANSEWAWDQATRHVMAVQADTGTVLWDKERRVAPLTLAVDGERVFFYDGERVVCLDRTDGDELWGSEPVPRKSPFPTGYGPTLVVQQGVVLLSVENRSMHAFSAVDGETLWAAPHHRGGHMSPDDMLVIDGLVWSGAVANGADSGVFTGRDVQTGEVKSEFPPDVNPPWFHHRCYRSRATDKYFIASRTGTEFIDLKAEHWDINHWVRGGCLYGFMPCNGLIYAPPNSCGCFLESKLFGFSALAPQPNGGPMPQEVSDDARLQRGPLYGVPLGEPASTGVDQWPTYRHDALRSGSVKSSVPTDLKRVWQADLDGKLSSVVVAGGKVFVAAVDAHTVHVLDADSGKPAWSYTVGGRVDSPPTIHRGRVLFGSADGWVYCLRAEDGGLVWRFRAVPDDRRVIAYEQLESAWPVSGSVLVHDDVVYCVAGRSAFLDGGMRLVRLDPKTGRKLSETVLDERDPETGENLQSKMLGQDMPVALPDILSCDGRSVYMRSQAFDLQGVRRNVAPVKLSLLLRRRGNAGAEDDELTEVDDHLFSRSGFLDDSWFFRSYWIYGKAVDSNYGGWLRPGHFAPSGRLMVFDDTCVYGFDRKPEYLCNASVQEYYLYRADREVSDESIRRVQAATGRINAASPQKSASSSDWATRKKFSLTDQSVAAFRWANAYPPIQARAMVLADETLFVAGPPDVVNEEEAFRNPIDPAIRARLEAQAAALQGRLGGQMLVVSAADGNVLRAWELGATPTFDGMAAAGGRLYLTTVDGAVLCLGGEGTPLPEAEEVKLEALDVGVKPPPPEPKLESGPSLKGDFAKVVRAQVTGSQLGYRVGAGGKRSAMAVKKLPTPLRGKVHLKGRLQCAPGGQLKNGFLVFGDTADEAGLVKCGLRFKMQKAVIVEGPFDEGKTVEEDVKLDEAKVYEADVTVELATGQVTMKAGGVTVTATLDRCPKEISYVGYAVLNTITDFTLVEISGD